MTEFIGLMVLFLLFLFSIQKHVGKKAERNQERVILPLIHEFSRTYACTSEFQEAEHWKVEYSREHGRYEVTRLIRNRDILEKQTDLCTFICVDNGNSSLQVTRIVAEEPISVNSYKDFCVITERNSTKKVTMMLIFDCDKVPKELQFVAKNNNQNESAFLFKREEVTMGVYRWVGEKIK